MKALWRSAREVDVASEGDTIEEARANLQAALKLFFGIASEAEIAERLHSEVYVTTLEVTIGEAAYPPGRDVRRRPRAGTS